MILRMFEISLLSYFNRYCNSVISIIFFGNESFWILFSLKYRSLLKNYFINRKLLTSISKHHCSDALVWLILSVKINWMNQTKRALVFNDTKICRPSSIDTNDWFHSMDGSILRKVPKAERNHCFWLFRSIEWFCWC